MLASNSQGGTVGALLSFIAVRGLPIIMPIGLEKLIPDVIEAANGWGQRTLDRSMGEKAWLVPVTCGLVVTEIEALGILAGVEARHIASGGIGGSEGAVVLLLEGTEQELGQGLEDPGERQGRGADSGATAQLQLLRAPRFSAPALARSWSTGGERRYGRIRTASTAASSLSLPLV